MSPNQPANQPRKPAGSQPSAPSGPRHTDPEDLVLYALQFLAGEEAAAIAHHLDQCAECRDELARIQGDLAACAFTAETHSPPPQVRQRLLAQIARESNVLPFAPPASPAQPIPPIPAEAEDRLAGDSPSNRSDDSGDSDDSTPASYEDQRRRRHIGRALLGWTGWAVAAGLAVTAVNFHNDLGGLRESLSSQAGQIARLNVDAAHAHQLMDALADPNAMRVTLTVKPQPKPQPIGGATYNSGSGSLIFLASNLNPLQAYKVYELWLIPANGDPPVPAVTFRPDDKGNASVILTDMPKGIPAKAFGVTVEAEGGAQTPTLPIIMAGS